MIKKGNSDNGLALFLALVFFLFSSVAKNNNSLEDKSERRATQPKIAETLVRIDFRIKEFFYVFIFYFCFPLVCGKRIIPAGKLSLHLSCLPFGLLILVKLYVPLFSSALKRVAL